MADLMAIAQELSKMRKLAQRGEQPGDMRQCYGEVLMLARYNRLPSIVDFKRESKKRVAMYPKDENGALIRVVAHNLLPWRVYKSWLNADVFVLIKSGSPLQTSSISGWLPRDVLVQMPMNASQDHFLVAPSALIDMPEEFSFVEPEHHAKNQWNGIWSDSEEGWECCTCGRIIPDVRMRELDIV